MPPSRMRLGALATLVFGGMSLILGMELLPSARAVESPCFSDPTQPDCSDASSYCGWPNPCKALPNWSVNFPC
jgi:hypothetical protein